MRNQHARVDFFAGLERVDWCEWAGGDGSAGKAEEVDKVVA